MRVPLPETMRVNAMCVPSGDGTGHQSNGAGAGRRADAGTATTSSAPSTSSAATARLSLLTPESYAAGIRDR